MLRGQGIGTPDASQSVPLKREQGGGDASSPQHESVACVASLEFTKPVRLRRSGDEGVATTRKRRGVASTLRLAFDCTDFAVPGEQGALHRRPGRAGH
jgi:hypothetical protein